MKRLALTLLLAASCCVAKGQNQPQPAPKHSLLVMDTCYAWMSQKATGSPLENGNYGYYEAGNEGCDRIIKIDREILVPGEFRTFIRLLGPDKEYVVSCLGKARKHTTWAHGGVEIKGCVAPGYKNGFWLPDAIPGIPTKGDYVDAAWQKDGSLSVPLYRDYHDKEKGGTLFNYKVVRVTQTSARLLAPGEQPREYTCPNGAVEVNGFVKCRPEE